MEREQEGMAEDMDEEATAAAAAAAAAAPASKRVKHNTLGVGKTSGRDWKHPGERAGSLRNPNLGSSWEKKMSVKAEENAFKERKKAAAAARGEQLAAERLRREGVKKRKAEAQAKAAIVTRVSSATAKRMMKSKKARKLLRTGDA